MTRTSLDKVGGVSASKTRIRAQSCWISYEGSSRKMAARTAYDSANRRREREKERDREREIEGWMERATSHPLTVTRREGTWRVLPLIRSTPASFSVPASGIRRNRVEESWRKGAVVENLGERDVLAGKDGLAVERVLARECALDRARLSSILEIPLLICSRRN